jgi:hypothetical protein
MALFKPRVRPSLTSPVIFNPPPPTTAITDLDPGTDYRVVMPSTPYNGRLWLRGGRKVHIGWGSTPSAHGGEIRQTAGNSSCLIVEDMEECWIEGIVALKYDGSGNPSQGGNCFQIRCTTTSFPVYILNCYGAGMVADPAIRGAAIVHVRNGTCPNLVIDGLTGLTYAEGILKGLGLDSSGADITDLSMTRVNIGWGSDFPRVLGNLIAIDPPTAQYFDTYLVDKAAPTAAIASLYDGTRDTTDAQGNLIFGPTTGIDGTLWKGEPPAGDWVPQAECGLNYVAPGYESGSAPLPSMAAASGRLLYHPDFVVPLTSPTTTNVGAGGGTVTLGSGDHRIITLNSGTGAVTGNVTVNGVAGSGNRIHIIGGQITNATEDATAASHCLRINNVDYVYIEGVKGAKGNTAGDFINLAGTWKLVVIQNCRGIGMNTRDVALGHSFTQHGDFFQAQTRGGLILMDRCTGDTWNQGIVLDASLSPASSDPNYEGVVLSRVNMRVNDTALNPIQPADATHPLFYLQNCCGTSCRIPVWLNDVWGFDEQAISPRTIAQMVAPSASFGTTACGANYDSVNLTVTWPVANRITGLIKYGIPPGGDFVPDTFTGLNYVTPGYAGPPLPLRQRGAYQLTLDHTPTALDLVQAAAGHRSLTAPTASDPAWANRQIAIDGAFVEHATVPARLPAPAAPAFLTPPTARADTVSGGTVGEVFQIAYSILANNDLFDPRTGSIIASAIASAVGCTVTTDDDSVNVTPTQQTPVSFQATMEDSKGGTSSATVTITGVQPGVTPPPDPPPPTGSGNWFGCPYIATGLGETYAGRGSGRSEAYIPFRAPQTGNITHCRFYNIKPYGNGTGGDMRLRIVQSTTNATYGRMPTRTQVGTGQATATSMLSRGTFENYAFSSPIPVIANTLYYMQHVNTDPSSSNYYAIDIMSANWNGTSANPGGFSSSNPQIAEGYYFLYTMEGLSLVEPADFIIWETSSATASFQTDLTRTAQCFELTYSDGTYISRPYMESGGYGSGGTPSEQDLRTVTSTLWHRQRFTAPSAMTLTHFACCYRPNSTSGGLLVELRTSTSGAALRSFTIPASNFPVNTLLDTLHSPNGYHPGAVFNRPVVTLSPALALTAGQTVYATMRSTGGTTFTTYPIRCGDRAGYGFHRIHNSELEASQNSGNTWTRWPTQSGNTSTSQYDMGCCFRIA